MKRLALIICVIILGIAPIWLRVSYESKRSYYQGMEQLGAGNYSAGINYLGEALRWHLPGDSWSNMAYLALWDNYQAAQTKEDRILVLRSLHAGLSAGRTNLSLLQSTDYLAMVRERLLAELPEQQIAEIHPASLAWSAQLIAQAGFILWLGGTIAACIFGVLPGGRLVLARFVQSGIVALGGYGIWLYGLMQ